jgi:hypothetical protein
MHFMRLLSDREQDGYPEESENHVSFLLNQTSLKISRTIV